MLTVLRVVRTYFINTLKSTARLEDKANIIYSAIAFGPSLAEMK